MQKKQKKTTLKHDRRIAYTAKPKCGDSTTLKAYVNTRLQVSHSNTIRIDHMASVSGHI